MPYDDTPYEWEVLEAEVNLKLTDADFGPPEPGPATKQTGLKPGGPLLEDVTKKPPQGKALDKNSLWRRGVGAAVLGLLMATYLYFQSTPRTQR